MTDYFEANPETLREHIWVSGAHALIYFLEIVRGCGFCRLEYNQILPRLLAKELS